jgi:hypothetical protein
MFKRLFVDHPQSVNENYLQHFVVASWFGIRMIGGGLCALVHAVVPGLCARTGGDTALNLARGLIEQRRAKGEDIAQILSVDWVI